MSDKNTLTFFESKNNYRDSNFRVEMAILFMAEFVGRGVVSGKTTAKEYSEISFQAADAMLAERKK